MTTDNLYKKLIEASCFDGNSPDSWEATSDVFFTSFFMQIICKENLFVERLLCKLRKLCIFYELV